MNYNTDDLSFKFKELLNKYLKLNNSDKQSLIKEIFDNKSKNAIEEIWIKLSYMQRINESVNGLNIKVALEHVNSFLKENSEYKCGYISKIFSFPFSTVNEYVNYIEKNISDKSVNWYRGGADGKGLYNKILREEMLVQDPLIPSEINLKCNGVYVIANEKGNVIYIGKRQDNTNGHVIVRFLDHLVLPKSLHPHGQSSNKDAFVWEYINYLSSTNGKLKCFICFDLNFNAAFLEKDLLKLKNTITGEKKRH